MKELRRDHETEVPPLVRFVWKYRIQKCSSIAVMSSSAPDHPPVLDSISSAGEPRSVSP